MSYWLTISLAALFGGSVPTLAKIALEVFPTFVLVFLRFFVATVTLLPFVIKKKELNIRTFKSLSLVGVVGALNPILLFIALRYTQASVSPLIYAASPLVTALYFSRAKAEKIAERTMKGIIIGLMGVATIVILPLITSNSSQQLSLGGNLLIFSAMLAFVSYGILSKKKQQTANASPVALTFYFSFFSLLISIPFALRAVSSHLIPWSQIMPSHWLSAVATGVTGTTLFYLIYQNAIKKGGATAASLFTYLQPIVGIALPVALLGETITPPFIIGGLLAVIGVRQATRSGN